MGVEKSGSFHLISRRRLVQRGQGLYQSSYITSAGHYWIHIDGDRVILSNDRLGMELAGPAADAARRNASEDALVEIHPATWARDQKQDLANWLNGLLTYLHHGRALNVESVSRIGLALGAANAAYYLHPIMNAGAASFALKLDKDGAALELKTTPAPGKSPPPALTPVLDRSLVGSKPPAALGAFDCNSRLFVRQRALTETWKATNNPGAAELGRLIDVEASALDGTCSFAVHTDNEVWAEEASYPLRAGAPAEPLTEALVDAIRSGGLPNMQSGMDDLKTAKLLFSKEGGVLSIDRVLGGNGTPGPATLPPSTAARPCAIASPSAASGCCRYRAPTRATGSSNWRSRRCRSRVAPCRRSWRRRWRPGGARAGSGSSS